MIRVFLICILASSCLWANELSWSEYRNSYLSNDPELAQAKLALEKAQAQAREKNALNTTRLTINPSLSESEFSFNNNEIQSESLFLNTSLEQSLFFGSKLLFSYTKDLSPDDLAIGRVDRDYSLGLTQPIWNNAFGAADRKLAEAAELRLKAQQANFKWSYALACERALELYGAAFYSQKSLELFTSLVEEANRAMRLTEQSYRKRLVRKIDWLAAENDALELKTRVLRFETTYASDWEKLTQYVALEKQELNMIEIPKIDEPDGKEVFYSVEAKALIAEATELEYLARKSFERSNLDLNFQLGAREGAQFTNLGLEDYTENYLKLSLKWSLPIFEPDREARVKQSYLTAQQAIEELKESKATSATQLKSQKAWLDSMLSIYSLHKERVKALEKQLQEAKSLLSASRIEYQDYLAYRNQWFQELREGLDVLRQIWNLSFDYALLLRQEAVLCGEPQ